jgi:hypothetical protein
LHPGWRLAWAPFMAGGMRKGNARALERLKQQLEAAA